jgi:hypothetical protein
MIEPIMFIGIGFLIAGLLLIGAIPMVHARAVRLTHRRLEAMTPMSMAEIHADRDLEPVLNPAIALGGRPPAAGPIDRHDTSIPRHLDMSRTRAVPAPV